MGPIALAICWLTLTQALSRFEDNPFDRFLHLCWLFLGLFAIAAAVRYTLMGQ